MDIANNLFVMLFALVPIIVYVSMFNTLVPKKMISLDRGRRYFISGLMSPFLVLLVYFIFPNWGNNIGNDYFFNYVFYAIVQIGVLEEVSKLIIIQWVTAERLSSKNDLPIATVFYSFMVALGFGLTENVSYLMTHYENTSIIPLISESAIDHSLIKLVSIRSITAVLMHIICGIIIGFFLHKSYELKKRNRMKDSINKLKMFIHNKLYIVYGLSFAALYHGIYDLNLLLPDNNYNLMFTAIILLFGLSIAGFMIKNMIELSKYRKYIKNN